MIGDNTLGRERQDQQYEYGSDTNGEEQDSSIQKAEPQGQRTMQRARQNRARNQALPPQADAANGQIVQPQNQQLTGTMGGNTGAIRQSRIKDRPVPKETRDSSLKIKIELDLEVEVDLYARVKGDVTIGLM
jgi:hypothetical protein